MNAPVTMTALHKNARAWAEQGFPIFPCVERGKEPATRHGHKNATTDLAQIDAWWTQNGNFNIGCPPDALDPPHTVIDSDPPRGEDTLKALSGEFGPLPETLTIQTPRGGSHLWYVGRARSTQGDTGGLGPKVDTRGIGGYVLLPPSIVNGKQYTVVRNIEAADLPEWVLRKLEKKSSQAVAANVELDLPVNIERARARLKALVKARDVAIEGKGGDSRTYQLAAEIGDFGLSEDMTFDLINEEWNPSCVPPWSEDELRTKVANAMRYRQNPAGVSAVEPISEAFKDFAHPKSANGPVSFSTVLTRTVPPVQELIPGLIEKGTVTFLSAPGGSHKSRLAVQWGLSIDAGLSVFARAVERATFVYVSYEDHPDEVARRSQVIARCLHVARDSAGQYWDLSGKDAPLASIAEDGTYELQPFWQRLHDHLRSLSGHKFLVLDSCYNALRFAGQAKINETCVMVGIGLLQRLCDETDCTILILWHPSQAGQERGDASGWSVAWHNAPRARLSLAPVKDTEDAFELKVEKRNHGPKGKPITLYWSNGVLLPRGETDAAENATRFADVCVRVAISAAKTAQPIQFQKKLSGWMLDEIEKAVGYRPNQREVKETLATAMRASRLRYIKGTQYRTAGYYPPDMERAVELANAAKHGTRNGGDDE